MLIGGLQKTTLIDYPGKVACTVFLVGCNFRCPFCHNRDLVSPELFKKTGIVPISEKEFFDFLDKRKKILDGVCITGGEPTINQDLCQFIKKIKVLGLSVKLDTNGSNPEVLKKLIKEKLLDYIAMDLKTDFEEYSKAIRIINYESKIKESIEILLRSKLNFEFRTTVVPGLHNKKNLVKLAKQLKNLNLKAGWFLQNFRAQNCLDETFLQKKPFTLAEMKKFVSLIKPYIPTVKLRE